MRVAGADAVLAPTAAELKAKEQVAARQAEHNANNAARKLTPQQRAEKLRRKWADPEGTSLEVRVFRVGDLADGRRRFKVEKNAKQYELTGVALLQPHCNVVVVEGYPTALRKYAALLTRRVKWDQAPANDDDNKDSDDDDDGDADGDNAAAADGEGSKHRGHSQGSSENEGPAFGSTPHKDCVAVWRGVVSARAFRDFTMEGAGSALAARSLMERAGVPQYWDLAYQMR